MVYVNHFLIELNNSYIVSFKLSTNFRGIRYNSSLREKTRIDFAIDRTSWKLDRDKSLQVV